MGRASFGAWGCIVAFVAACGQAPEVPQPPAPAALALVGAGAAEAPVLAWQRALQLGAEGGARAARTAGGDVLVAAAAREVAHALPGVEAGAGLVLARLSPAGEVRRAVAWRGTAAPFLSALAAAPDGGWVVALRLPAALAHAGGRLPRGTSVARLGADGRLTWARALEGEGALHVAALAVGAGGEVYVGGELTGRRTLAAQALDAGSGAPAAFVARLEADGGGGWARVLGRGGGGTSRVRALALDAGGTPYVAGEYAGVVAVEASTWVSVRRATPFVARLEPAGGHVAWARELDGAEGEARALGVADGRVVLAGTLRAGGFQLGATRVAAEGEQGFVAAWDEAGHGAWGRALGRSATALALEPDGEAWVAGGHDGELGGGGGAYLARLLPEDGTLAGAHALAGPVHARVTGVALGPGGDVVLALAAGAPGEEDGLVARLRQARPRSARRGP